MAIELVEFTVHPCNASQLTRVAVQPAAVASVTERLTPAGAPDGASIVAGPNQIHVVESYHVVMQTLTMPA